MKRKPDYEKIAFMELEVYGEIITVDVRAFKYNCLHCRTINWPPMHHAYDCPYKEIQT